MIIMALIYVAGLVSGVILVAILLGTWIAAAAKNINERNRQGGTPDKAADSPAGRPDTGQVTVARHRANRRRRPGRPAAAAP